jgi:hypothetical protein
MRAHQIGCAAPGRSIHRASRRRGGAAANGSAVVLGLKTIVAF